jgi:hypothetical protein
MTCMTDRAKFRENTHFIEVVTVIVDHAMSPTHSRFSHGKLSEGGLVMGHATRTAGIFDSRPARTGSSEHVSHPVAVLQTGQRERRWERTLMHWLGCVVIAISQ